MRDNHIPIEQHVEPRGCSGSCCQGRAPCDCDPHAIPGAGLVWATLVTVLCVIVGFGLHELVFMLRGGK